MRILLIGSGGREHALSWKISQSTMCDALFVAPGNAGIKQSVDINIADQNAVLDFCEKMAIDFVIIGPEKPLADGLSDILRDNGYPVFGPSQSAARLESSKAFMKTICRNANVATADYHQFTDCAQAIAHLDTVQMPIVIKADGLAAGKGVIIAQDITEAQTAIREIMDERCFGASGDKIIIETFLHGEEVSVFALCDGETVRYIGHAQDHKRVFDGDNGPNTGGMGAFAMAPILDHGGVKNIMETIIQPVAKAMYDAGCPFHGVLYAGLMMTNNGAVVIEFNARFGDPECQVLMPLIDQDIVPLLYATATGSLYEHQVTFNKKSALCVVMASKGYPNDFVVGSVIDEIPGNIDNNVMCFYASTKYNANNELIAVGGRVLCVVAVADSLQQAQNDAYSHIKKIKWDNGFYRTDIGYRALR